MIDSTCAIKVQMLNILDNKSYNSTICEPFLCRQISVQIFVEFASIGNLLSVASNSGLRRPIKLADPQFFINIYDILKYIKLADSQTYFTKKCWNRRYSAIHPSRLPIVTLILTIMTLVLPTLLMVLRFRKSTAVRTILVNTFSLCYNRLWGPPIKIR